MSFVILYCIAHVYLGHCCCAGIGSSPTSNPANHGTLEDGAPKVDGEGPASATEGNTSSGDFDVQQAKSNDGTGNDLEPEPKRMRVEG